MRFELITFIIITSVINTYPLKHAKPNLSEYDFFTHPLKNQIPSANVYTYSIASPLFTDYALKSGLFMYQKSQN